MPLVMSVWSMRIRARVVVSSNEQNSNQWNDGSRPHFPTEPFKRFSKVICSRAQQFESGRIGDDALEVGYMGRVLMTLAMILTTCFGVQGVCLSLGKAL